MRKKIILIIAAIGLFSTGFAQFTYGPKLGVNMSRMANDNLRPGFQAGAFLNGEFYDRMGVQVDFLWTLKGTSNKKTDSLITVTTNTITGLPVTNTSTISLVSTTYYRFVDIPICVYFPISEHIRGFVGPQLSMFRHATNTYTAGSAASVKTDKSGIKGETSICLGFDFKFDSPIIIGLRFVTNKFTGGTAGGSAGTEATAQTLNSFMVNFAYKMDW